jgi:hypothetical protein
VPSFHPDPADPESLKEFIMALPPFPVWGTMTEAALREELCRAGFTVTRCRCLDTHPVLHVRMKPSAGEPQPVAAVRRLLRRVARGLGWTIPRGGLNCVVRHRGSVEAEIVLEQPTV